MMPPQNNNPFYRDPEHPHFNRRAYHHDYCRPARYLITIMKNPDMPVFVRISGNPHSTKPADMIVSLSPLGLSIRNAISKWMRKYPIVVEEYCVMPDHIHLCVKVVSFLPNGLSRAIANFMGMVTTANWESLPIAERPEIKTPVFSKGFNDRIAYCMEQWNRQKQYTADNPRRYLFKKNFPDFLLKKWILTCPISVNIS